MAAGVIIGRVSVKVIPDTSDFKEQLERDLNALERDLKPIEIDITVDTDGVVREAKKARDAAQKEMKDLTLKVNEADTGSISDAINKLNRELVRLGEVDIKVNLDEDELAKEIERLNGVLNEVRTLDLEINEADPASVKQTVDKLNNELAKIKLEPLSVQMDEASLTAMRDNLRDKMDETYREVRENVQRQLRTIQIGMDVDPVQAARTIRKIEVLLEQIEDAKMTITPDMDERARFATLRKIQDMKDQVEDMKATIHPDLDSPAALALSARLALLARDRVVEFVPRMNRAGAAALGMAFARMSGARLLSGYMKDLYDSIIQFDRAVPKIIGLSTAVGGLGIVGLTASSNLFALSASLASIAPAGLALPGILGGIGVGVGVTIAALKDFNKIFPDVADAFSEMQDSISENFWSEAAGNMRILIDGALPLLATGFDKVATASGKFFSSLAASATDRLLPALPAMFDNLAKSIEIARAAADPIVGIITTLGEVGASYLPRLAEWFVDITTQFDNFLTRSTNSGEIFTWIDNGIQALKDLWDVGKNAVLILSDIADAAQAAGGSSLGMMADGLERIRAITSSAGFKDGLTEVFRSAHTAMDYITSNAGPGVVNLFKSLGDLIPAILPTIGAAVGELIGMVSNALAQPEVANGVQVMFEGIRTAISNLSPAFDPLARALATVGPLVSDLAINLSTVLGAAIPPVADALVRMGEAIQPLIPAIGTLLLAAVEALAPVVTNLSNAFVSIMEGGLLDLIISGFEGLAAAITAIPTPVLTGLVAALGGIAIAAGLFSAAVTIANFAIGIWSAVAAIATGVTTALGVAFAILTSPITLVIAAIALVIAAGVLLYKNWDTIKEKATEIWGAIKDFISDAMSAVKRKMSEEWAKIKADWSAGWEAVKSGTSNAWNAIKGFFSSAWSVITSGVSTAWNGIKSAFSSAWGVIKSGVDSAWSGIKSAFSTAWSTIQSGVSSAWGTIKSAFSTGMSNAKSAVDTGWNNIKSAFSSAGSAIKDAAVTAWNNVVSAFRTGVSNAADAARGLIQAAKNAVSGAGSALVSAGRQIIDGFIDGISAGFGRVQSTLGRLTSMLPDWKGPAPRDRTLLVEAGQLVIGGFIDGLESQYGAVKDSLRGLTEDMGSMFGEPITAEMQTAMPKADVRKGLVGSVRTAVTESQSLANGKTLIYHAAPGSSLGAEEDLFAAADRGRMVGW